MAVSITSFSVLLEDLVTAGLLNKIAIATDFSRS